MLSAFTARPIVELKQRDKSKIESILAYGDRVFVGLNTGSLRIYRVNETPEDDLNHQRDASTATATATATDGSEANGNDVQAKPPPKPRLVDLLREEEKFAKRGVQQLAIIKEANLLLSLSDGYVSLHDVQSYALQSRLEKTKGASVFAVTSNIVKDAQTGIPSIVSRLAVAVKRKIILWKWADMEMVEEGEGEGKGEISLPASVKSLTWASATKVLAGMDPGFVLVDVDSGSITDINKPGSNIGAVDAGVRFGAINSSGMSYMGMGGWVPKPMATKLAEGEMLLAKDVNTLFIDADDGKARDKRQIPWAQAPETVGYSYPYLLALQPAAKGALEVRNPDTLSLLQTIALPNAGVLHVPQPNISLAHAAKGFLVASERVVWRMAALDYDSQIEELIGKERFDEAISLLGMLEDTLLKDKEGKLREVRILKAHALFEARRYRQAFEYFSEAKAPPERVISLYPRSIAGDLAPEESVKDEESVAGEEDGSAEASKAMLGTTPSSTVGKSLLGLGRSGHSRADSDTSSIRSGKGGSAFDSSPSKSKESVTGRGMEGKDFAVAVNELCRFLVQIHGQLLKVLNPDGSLKEDTPHNKENSTIYPLIMHLLNSSSDSDDWTQQLKDVATLVDTTLFKAYMLVNPGLAGSLFRLSNFCDPAVVTEKLYESSRYTDLIDFLQGKKLHREALTLLAKFGKCEEMKEEEVMPQLRGPRRTVQYLQMLPPEMIDVILEFTEWPVRADRGMGMEVFIADTENAETLPRHKVLDFLASIDDDLAVRYLEHIIDELDDMTAAFHQRLVELYLKTVKDKESGEEKKKAELRDKLLSFLQKSGEYNKWRIFQMLPADDPDFYEARAVVLSKMGQHKQALSIYVFQLRDYEKAEEYVVPRQLF
ncbi:vacuolar morphogenesis protein-like protein AvaB [Rhizodiscina lignyota]|uniref:Vacuolar morphogenesis protein-like protein AvaB n=1 Tax=Rhizodiscina lignyota TaxID=1504668 RepID=A0A9P4M3E1_9PEZI|nr:vacuolar morphogenesis protein-like protein AvaB [Rhizodiscina lignyota]